MPTSLPPDEVLMERAIRGAIVDILENIPDIGKVWDVQRYPESDEEDIAISTVPDPVTPDRDRTRIVEVGIPLISESEYTSDHCTQLDFVYPITLDIEVVDNWDKAGLEYQNSQELAIGLYLKARRAFKFNRTLGFNNCVHDYLQQVSAVRIDDEETGGKLNALDWSLTVHVTGVLV